VIYLCAGVFAEGSSDYAFLLPLVTRVLYEVSTSVPQLTEVADAVGIDARRPIPKARANRIAKAIRDHEGQCSLFVIHADADGDSHAALRERVDPGRHAAGIASPIVACIPVREMEAWILSDQAAFTALIAGAEPELPRDPEADMDPKRTLSRIYEALRIRGARGDYYRFFGENVALDNLRRLSAFRRFEDELRAAVEALGRADPRARR
jgi:hypothetical protein